MGLVLRFVSLVLLVTALMLLGADALTSIGRDGVITVRSIEQIWRFAGPASMAGFQGWLGHSLPSPMPAWVNAILALPTWSLTGVFGVVLAFLFGRHAPGRA